jgi:hypothetical protein
MSLTQNLGQLISEAEAVALNTKSMSLGQNLGQLISKFKSVAVVQFSMLKLSIEKVGHWVKF